MGTKQGGSPRLGKRARTAAPRRLGDGTGFPPDLQKKTRPYLLHDQCNLVAMFVLSSLCLAGLADAVDCWQVTLVFTVYIVLDLGWVLLVPESVPRYPGIITVHHVMTLALLLHPLRHPEDARFTCLDGLVELSTFFMIARRHCSGRLSAACNVLYWASTIALRFVLQPFLLYKFHDHTREYERNTRAVILVSQTFLCLFNFGCARRAAAAPAPLTRPAQAGCYRSERARLQAQVRERGQARRLRRGRGSVEVAWRMLSGSADAAACGAGAGCLRRARPVNTTLVGMLASACFQAAQSAPS